MGDGVPAPFACGVGTATQFVERAEAAPGVEHEVGPECYLLWSEEPNAPAEWAGRSVGGSSRRGRNEGAAGGVMESRARATRKAHQMGGARQRELAAGSLKGTVPHVSALAHEGQPAGEVPPRNWLTRAGLTLCRTARSVVRTSSSMSRMMDRSRLVRVQSHAGSRCGRRPAREISERVLSQRHGHGALGSGSQSGSALAGESEPGVGGAFFRASLACTSAEPAAVADREGRRRSPARSGPAHVLAARPQDAGPLEAVGETSWSRSSRRGNSGRTGTGSVRGRDGGA